MSKYPSFSVSTLGLHTCETISNVGSGHILNGLGIQRFSKPSFYLGNLPWDFLDFPADVLVCRLEKWVRARLDLCNTTSQRNADNS